jgi:hypothetical protein
MSGADKGVEPPDKTGGGGLIMHTGPPASSSTTNAWALGGEMGTNVRMRSFAEIIADEKVNRNILEIHLSKIADQNTASKVKPLNYDDMGELIFDVLLINPADCISYNYTTGRYNTKEVKFKPGFDLSHIIKPAFEFKGHEVTTKKQMNNLTKVSFINVPINVPDEDIIELCKCYGSPVNNIVNYERMFNMRNRGMMGSTRWVEMELKSGVCMNNFYWMEGPLPGDKGTRVTALHSGQELWVMEKLVNSKDP